MKKTVIPIQVKRSYRERAHLERSLAFHQGLRIIGCSVKNLLSQPEKFLHKVASQKRRTRNKKSDAMLMHGGCRQ